MTHEEASMQTKKALSDSLKELMKHKAFSKITVSELIKLCNVNRKTFYYHFEDIYDLLRWTIDQEAVEVVKQYDLLTDYQDAILFAINYVEDNSFFLNCAYNSVGREQLKRFFCKDFMSLIEQIIRNTEKQTGYTIDNHFRSYLINLYTEGIAGMLVNMFQNPDCYKKNEILEYTDIMINHSIPAVLKAASEK